MKTQMSAEDRAQFEQRVRQAKSIASGRWTEMLGGFGIPDEVLSGKDTKCPTCEGPRRGFRYDDKYGNGDSLCHGACGSRDGFALLMEVKGWSFLEALKAVEERVGGLPPQAKKVAKIRGPEEMKSLLNATWSKARSIGKDDPVGRYLVARGVEMDAYPKVLRAHPMLDYFEKDEHKVNRRLGAYPALLAKVQDLSGKPMTLHRIYVDPNTPGDKAPVSQPKKPMNSGIKGCGVYLYEAGEELALAEGIETALAVRILTGLPVWACRDAGGLEAIVLPQHVRKVYIYADNDENFRGQLAAYTLAHRLTLKEGRQVEVKLPQNPGDWLDVLVAKRRILVARRPIAA